MAYYQYHHLNGVWFKTGIIPTINTRVEVDYAGFHSYTTHSDAYDPYGGGWPSLVGSNNVDWDNTKFIIKCYQSGQTWNCGVGNKDYNGPSVVLDTFHTITLDRYYYTVDGTQYSINTTSMSTSDDDIWIGAVNLNGQMFRCGDCYIGDVRVYESGALIAEYKPSENNGDYTYYDTVSETYLPKYGSGTIEPGPSATVFEPSQYDFDFGFNGGTQTFTVEADNAWTCTAPTDFTISPMSGSAGTTTVTITAPRRISTVSDTVTFTDSQSNTFDISISQSVGTITPNLTLYQGATTIKKMYHGSGLTYRKMAHNPSLVISGDSFTFPPTSYTAATVVVTTDANWSYSTEANWLSLTKTGNNLEIVPASDWDQGSTPRTATVTVTADNGFITKSATINVTQKNNSIQNVDWVYTPGYNTVTGAYLDTGIYPTVNTSFKVKYIPVNPTGAAIVGYTPYDSRPSYQSTLTPLTAGSTTNGWRLFDAGDIDWVFWDFNLSRLMQDNFLATDADGYVTVECGNYYVTNLYNQNTLTGTLQSEMAAQNVPVYINLSSDHKIQSLEIFENGTKVYDGHSAYDGENYGWYDSISGTFSTQTYGGYALTGAPVPDLTDYLCFTAEQSNSTVGMMNYRTDASIDTPVLYYSRDKVMWVQWDYSPITLANVGDKLYIYGNNPSGICIDVNNYSTFQITGSVAASGDATTLITQNGTQTLTSSTFHALFKGCTALTSAPSLPATTLAPGCYSLMFFGCTSLTEAPALPATTLQDGCYDGMFYGCTRLATAPALPATTLVQYCYAGMFHGCTSLTTAPELPATTLVNNCYYGMFEGCTSLNYAKAAIMVWNTNDAYLWASNVASTGTVLVPTGSDIVAKGCNPAGWTVNYY